MPNTRLISILLVSLVLSFSTARAGGSASGGDVITQGQADEILTELKQIRRLLQELVQQHGEPAPSAPALPQPQTAPAPAVTAPEPPQTPPAPTASAPPRELPAPMTTKVSIADRPVLGEPDAPVTMVQFVDYECPYCRRFNQTAYVQLKREYIDPGRVRLVVKDLPLAFHPLARQAARAAHCAGEQGSYWAMHDLLYGGEAGLNPGALFAYAERLGLDPAAFKQCLESERYQAQIVADTAEAQAAGVPGTPAFVLGLSAGDTVEGAQIRGALPFEVFKGHIDRLLERADAK